MRTTPMRPTLLRLSAAALAVLTASACGATAKTDTTATSSADAGKPVSGLRLMVPNSPGGGYDTTARIGAKVMEDNKIASGIEVFNLSGAGGTVGLAKLINEKGNGDLAMMMGLGVVGATFTERIFSFPGIGQYGVDTITNRDVFGVVAVTAFAGVCVLMGAVLSDVMVAVLDPRVRLQ